MPKKITRKKDAPAKEVKTVCMNRECKLRKKKACAGFEGCPGFKGK